MREFRGTNGDNEIDPRSSDDDLIEGLDGDDHIFGFDGDDTLDGGEGDDTLIGEEGDDTLLGFRGEDLLFGVDGDDVLEGEGGDDTLRGGEGEDIFVFSTILGTGVDTIRDFTLDEDIIQVAAEGFEIDTDEFDRFDYDSGTGELSFEGEVFAQLNEGLDFRPELDIDIV